MGSATGAAELEKNMKALKVNETPEGQPVVEVYNKGKTYTVCGPSITHIVHTRGASYRREVLGHVQREKIAAAAARYGGHHLDAP